METTALQGGFTDPAPQSAHAFRALMEAMARPGTIHRVTGAIPPAPLSPAAGVALLTLCDADTPVHLVGAADTPEMRQWLAFHCASPVVDRTTCAFAIGTWEALMPLEGYPIGTAEYPDRSATLIVDLPGLAANGATLKGPGIRESATLNLPETAAFQANAQLFPLGLDFIFTAGDQLAALPRTTEVIPCM